MTPEEWVDHFRNLKPIRHTIYGDLEGMILFNLEKCLSIVKPKDANEIREHVRTVLSNAPYTNYCGD